MIISKVMYIMEIKKIIKYIFANKHINKLKEIKKKKVKENKNEKKLVSINFITLYLLSAIYSIENLPYKLIQKSLKHSIFYIFFFLPPLFVALLFEPKLLNKLTYGPGYWKIWFPLTILYIIGNHLIIKYYVKIKLSMPKCILHV